MCKLVTGVRALSERVGPLLPLGFMLGLLLLLGGCLAGKGFRPTSLLISGVARITDLKISSPESAGKVVLQFGVEGGGGHLLRARIEYVAFEEGPGWHPLYGGAPQDATPAAGSDDLESLSPGARVRFVWDAGRDIGRTCSLAQVVLTPLEGESPGEELRSPVFHAGRNTPVNVKGMSLSLQGSLVTASFWLADRESDPIYFLSAEASVRGSAFLPLPADIFRWLTGEFASRPEGAAGSLTFSLSDLDRPGMPEELRALGRSGFIGEVRLRLSFCDFPIEDPGEAVAGIMLDEYTHPLLGILFPNAPRPGP